MFGTEEEETQELCNIIRMKDGFNMSMRKVGGRWIYGHLGPACNRPAITMGRWYPAGYVREQGIVTVYLCEEHAEDLRHYTWEPTIERGYFMENPYYAPSQSVDKDELILGDVFILPQVIGVPDTPKAYGRIEWVR
jgi:hypothetical protein